MITNTVYNPNFIRNELLYVLYQIYFPLAVMRGHFTHYDLHWENILLYQPKQNGYIEYHYFTNNVVLSSTSFKSCYIVKIIDYGRCYYKDSDMNEHAVLHSSLNIFEKLSRIHQCDPYGGFRKGYNYLHSINSTKDHKIVSSRKNESHDLRLLSMLKSVEINKHRILHDINLYNNVLGAFISGVTYDSMYGTEEAKSVSYITPNYIINNVNDVIKALHSFTKSEVNRNNNNQTYANQIKIGDMYIYGDGSPMRYIPIP